MLINGVFVRMLQVATWGGPSTWTPPNQIFPVASKTKDGTDCYVFFGDSTRIFPIFFGSGGFIWMPRWPRWHPGGPARCLIPSHMLFFNIWWPHKPPKSGSHFLEKFWGSLDFLRYTPFFRKVMVANIFVVLPNLGRKDDPIWKTSWS